MDNTGIVWLAAALAPSAVAPHPNFPPKVISAPEVLALIAQRRHYRELERFELTGASAEEREFLDVLKASLMAETQKSSIPILLRIAEDPHFSPGMKAAAALFAAVALSELDRSDEAASVLSRVILDVSRRREPGDCSSSRRLIVAALLQQRVFRLQEQADPLAMRDVNAVLEWLPLSSQKDFEDFAVSAGVGWGARRVQLDMLASIKYHALLAQSSFDWSSGESWSRVVKTRSAWIDSRLNVSEAERDALVVRDVFEREVESTIGARHFMRTTAADEGYTALLLAELSGHAHRIWRCREALGKILMLQHRDNEHLVSEAIRLLRQGRGAGSLQSAVRWIRNQGPIEALRLQAIQVLDRQASWTAEEDLVLLEAACEYLSDVDLKRALHVVFRYPASPHWGVKAEWSVLDRTWKAVARLAPGSGADELIATNALKLSGEASLVSTGALASSISQALSALDWENVEVSTRSSWRNWASDGSEMSEGQVEIRDQIVESLHLDLSVRAGEGLELAAQIAEGLVEASPLQLEAARTAVIAAMDRDRSNASSGLVEWGGYESGNVAVAFSLAVNDDEVWRLAAEFLADPLVDRALKARALDRVASNGLKLPDSFVSTLVRNWDAILKSPSRDTFFETAPLPEFPEAVRAGSVLGILGLENVMMAVLKLCAGDDRSRIAAARTARYALGVGDPAWVFATLLQLAEDSNPDVRGEAAHSMAMILGSAGALREMVEWQLYSLASEEGVRVPLSIVYAAQLIEPRSLEEEFLRELSQRLLLHPARVVRRAAAVALRNLIPERPD